MKRNCLAACLLFLLTSFVFSAAASYGICFCDDAFYVTDNPVVDGLSLKGLRFAFTDAAQGIWMPLTYLTYMVDYAIGPAFQCMHVQSIVWHGVNVAILYLLLVRLFKSKSAAFVAALFWAIHPLRVESVVWIASRKDVVSTFFLLLSLHAWLSAERDRPLWLAASFALFLTGYLAKPSVIVFPVFILAIDGLVTSCRKDRRVYALAIALAAFLAWLTARCQYAGGAGGLSSILPMSFKLLNALAAVTVYLGNLVWPSHLAMQCTIRYPDPPMFSAVGALVFAALVAACGLCLYPRIVAYSKNGDWTEFLRGRPLPNVFLAGCVIFFGALAPFLGIAGFGVHAFADRFTLLPSLGFSVFIAFALARFDFRYLGCAVSAACLVLLGRQCRAQVSFWRDNKALIQHTLEVDRDKNTEMLTALGVNYWQDEHDMEKTYHYLSKALSSAWCESQRNGLFTCAHFLIEACYETGRTEEANDLYYHFRKLDYAAHGDAGQSAEFMMAEVLWLVHSKQENAIAEAERLLAKVRAAKSGSYIAANMAYVIAKAKGSEAEIRAALEECAAVKWSTTNCDCRWAKALLSR